jgi:phosphoribosylformylglycinamidine (FGAM) synthase PurS component
VNIVGPDVAVRTNDEVLDTGGPAVEQGVARLRHPDAGWDVVDVQTGQSPGRRE